MFLIPRNQQCCLHTILLSDECWLSLEVQLSITISLSCISQLQTIFSCALCYVHVEEQSVHNIAQLIVNCGLQQRFKGHTHDMLPEKELQHVNMCITLLQRLCPVFNTGYVNDIIMVMFIALCAYGLT